MRTLKSILLATDFRQASDEAASVAVQLASKFNSRVTLLHALDPRPSWPLWLDELREQAAIPLRAMAERLTDQSVQIAETKVAIGPLAITIVQTAKDMDADLILIGAGELSRFDRYSAGPVATAVIEHASQPVLAVRPGGPAARFQKILCPVDQSGAAARGLRNAIQLARAFGGQVVVLTVVPDLSLMSAAATTGQWSTIQTRYESQWHGEFEEFLTENALGDVPVTKDVRRGKTHEKIVIAAAEHQADLIVMGATGRTGLARVLVGSTTRRVLEQLPCSLLTVKEEVVVEENR